VYSALLLVLALSLTGFVYLLLLADLLALVQILIYGGTVSVLLLFALMLTPPQSGRSLNNRAWPLAALGGLVLLAALIYQAVATDWAGLATATGRPLVAQPMRVGPAEIGMALFSTWAVPFEIASLVLLVALIGGLFVAGATDRQEAEDLLDEIAPRPAAPPPASRASAASGEGDVS
jgi:NADH-quinone oxidoreductase subunit J